MKRSTAIPLEEDEQIAFVQWCRLKGFAVHHSGNEIGGATPALKARARKMKRMGTSAGFPDLLVFVPIPKTMCYEPFAIEMKRSQGGRTSSDQRAWIELLDLAGINAAVCHGAEAARKFIERRMKRCWDVEV